MPGMATTTTESLPAISAALVATELARIESSATFRRSPRHQHLLRYLVTRTLVGDSARLKESVLAVEVFGRDPARFDPQKDTTVRVEARRLRQKLTRFYEREGASCTLEIHLAAGGYVPTFELRPQASIEGLPSLVVLPFVNLSGDTTIDAWCDALTDELIDALVQLPGLKVVARTTSFSFKGRHVDVRQIAREVGVRTLLEGSVQSRSGGRRVVAQLIDGATGIHLWSHAFEADARDEIHRVVHALARAVVRGLSLQAGTVLLSRAAQRMSEDADARDSYQRGRYLLGRHTRDAYKDAAALFDRALARDPDFALAWAAKAKACIGLYGLAVAPDPDTVDSARAAVARALELDPELGYAHAAAATLAFAHDRDFARAERAALEAIRYAPGHAYVHHNYAWTLMFAGRFGEAEQEFVIARELDPLDPMLRVHHALVAFYRRDFDEAVEALRRALEMEPQNLVARVLSASAHLGRGAHDEALALFARIAADVPADSIGPLGVVQALALAGRMEEAQAAFDAMRESFGEARVGPYRMAIAFSRLGDADSAFKWLERAAAARDLNLVCLAVDPSFDALRDDPRWRPALARYGLPVIDPRAASH
jgi:TolB-like protein/Flp pilus assembly protein TadD